MHEDSGTIGQRLRRLRRWRGLSLKELADLAGVYPSQISTWENGVRLLDRRSHISALAEALKVSETELTGRPHLGTDRLQSEPHTGIPALRIALQTNSLTEPACEQARPLPDLDLELRARILPLFAACDYVNLLPRLSPAIDELHVHTATPADEPAKRQALEMLVEACAFAAFRAKDLGYPDLANLAATRAAEAAAVLGDPVITGKAAYVRLLTMPREGCWDRALLAAERAAGRLEPHVKADTDVQVLGMLTLTAALAAASVRKAEDAAHWLDAAGRLADRVPDDLPRAWHSFSKTNVSVWRVAIAVECGEVGGGILKIVRGVDEAKLAERKSRLTAFRIDVGRGLARDPKTRQDAVRWLRKAEEVAPQRTRNSAPARETVIYLRDRALASAARELRGMAARMGIPH
jgi:transcriptional regulator with XRE-family HTH domain